MIGLIRSQNREILDRIFLNYLFFEKLYVVQPDGVWPPGLFSDGSPLLDTSEEQSFREFTWCHDNGVFQDVFDDFDETAVMPEVNAFPGLAEMTERWLAPVRTMEESSIRLVRHEHFIERILSQVLEQYGSKRICSTQSAPDSLPFKTQEQVTIAHAYQISIQQLHIPERRTPWEELIRLKQDREFQNRRSRLFSYCAELASLSLTPTEVQEALQESLFDYNSYMEQLAKVKTVNFSMIILAAAEVVEEIVKFRLGKLTARFLDARGRQLEFAEKELQAPGRQVSALAVAQDKLSYD